MAKYKTNVCDIHAQQKKKESLFKVQLPSALRRLCELVYDGCILGRLSSSTGQVA